MKKLVIVASIVFAVLKFLRKTKQTENEIPLEEFLSEEFQKNVIMTRVGKDQGVCFYHNDKDKCWLCSQLDVGNLEVGHTLYDHVYDKKEGKIFHQLVAVNEVK